MTAPGAGPCLLLLRDSERRVYGAYCSELREARAGKRGESLFYGDGETRLIALTRGAGDPSDPGGTAGMAGTAGGGAAAYVAHAFEWSGRNRHFMCGDAVGQPTTNP